MIVDATPAILAFAEARKQQWLARDGSVPPTAEAQSVLTELNLIITLCDGLIQQNELLTSALQIGVLNDFARVGG